MYFRIAAFAPVRTVANQSWEDRSTESFVVKSMSQRLKA